MTTKANQTILTQIERFLRRKGMGASDFGRKAVGDPNLVGDLRRGRELRRNTADRVKRMMMSGGRNASQ